MTSDLVQILHSGGHSLVVCSREIYTYDGRGISDLYRLLNDGENLLAGASVADKVVGKGAAALMILGGVDELYADVISDAAVALLSDSDVKVTYDVRVPHIINRNGDGYCPVEVLCSECTTAAECLPLITEFITNILQK